MAYAVLMPVESTGHSVLPVEPRLESMTQLRELESNAREKYDMNGRLNTAFLSPTLNELIAQLKFKATYEHTRTAKSCEIHAAHGVDA